AGPAPAFAQERPARPPITFQGGLSLVRVTVTVRDESGALVRGLARQDFTLSEDDTPQQIDAFVVEELATAAAPAVEAPPVPAPVSNPAPPPPAAAALGSREDRSGRRLMVLLFDANGMEPEQLQRAVRSAHDYVDRRMTASDDVA